MDIQKSDFGGLIKSLVFGLLTILMLSQVLSQYIIQPLTYDGTLVRTGRFSFTLDAWDTIGENEQETIVGIGTSLTQYALSGNCIEKELDSAQSSVYNLGVPGSLPYIEMMQTTVAIQNSPSLILLEVNPINLYPLEFASEDYIEMRIQLNSLYLESSGYGEWENLLRPQDVIHLDGVVTNRFGSESAYFNSALEEHLEVIITDKEKYPHWYLSTPSPKSEQWDEYLREPPLLPRYLDSLNDTELKVYENETIIQKLRALRYNPSAEDNLNKIAIDYMVKQFSENNIPVVLVSYPIHPNAVLALQNEQFKEHNQTLQRLGAYHGVTVLNLIWDTYWSALDFYGIEHLDVRGREKLCSAIAPVIDGILNAEI